MPQTDEFVTEVSSLREHQLAQLSTIARALRAGVVTDAEQEYMRHARDVGTAKWDQFVADLRGRVDRAS